MVGLDLNPAVGDAVRARGLPRHRLRRDRRGASSCARSSEAVRAFGGLDMLVLNAGVFPGGRRIAAASRRDEWERVMRVNLDANLALLREAHPLLEARAARRPRGR